MLSATLPPPVPAAIVAVQPFTAVEARPVEELAVQPVEESPVEVPGLPLIATAAALEQMVLREGYAPGFHPILDENCRAIDAKTCHRMRCPACHTRGLDCRPYYRLKPGMPGGYRIVAACRVCPAAEVV